MLSWLVRFSLTQRLLVLVVTAIMVALGIWAYVKLPIDAYPDISTTQVQVIVKAPGMSPLEVEQRITRPIEIEVRGIPNQSVLRSLTKQALSIVTIDFEEGTDIYWARQQVNERINGVLAELPPGVDGGLAPITSPLSELYMFMVEGDGQDLMELRSILDWMIRPRLLSVDGVADINVLGGYVRTFQIEPRPADLRAYDLTLADVVQAIDRDNQNAGGDYLVRNEEVLLVRTVGRLVGEADFKGITVATREGTPIYLEQVANVGIGQLARYGGVSRNGQGEGVQGLVLLRTGANGRQTVAAVKQRLQEIKHTLPPGVKIGTVYDRSDLITKAVKTVEESLGLGVVLVLVVLSLFLGNLRSAFTTGLILPLTVVGTFLLMHLLGITANLMSLGGLAIAVGLLVDASVVVVENVHTSFQEQSRGFDRLHLVYRSVLEVAQPVVAAVLIIVATFLPILTLTGVEGKLFAPLALTISCALAVSLVLSLTVIPVVGSFVMKPAPAKPSRLISWLLRIYQPALDWALRRRRAAVLVAVAALAVAGSFVPFIGREFLPTLNEGTFVIQVEKLPSVSLERSMAIDLEIQKELMKVPEVVGVYSRVGSDELRLDPMGFHQTDNFLVTKPEQEWTVADPEALREKLRGVLDQFPWVSYGFTQPIDMRVSEMLTGVRSAVGIKLYGDDLEQLELKGRQIQEIVEQVPGAVDVFRAPLGGQKYIEIRMNRDALSRAGVSVGTVNDLVQSAIGGQIVSEVLEGSRRTPVVVRLPAEARQSVETISALQVPTTGGETMRLTDLADLHEVEGPYQVERDMGKRVMVVQTNVQDRDVVGFVEELRQRIRQGVKLPPGSYVTYGGQFENEQRASRRMALVGPGVMFFIFLLLFSTFGNVRQAALVLLNVPFALVGGIVVLFASGLYLSVPASVGFIALVGVAIENGVVLVSHFNELRRTGLSIDEAVRRGAQRRFRPVLMTAVLTILGLVPLLVATGPGSEIQLPLAVVVIGGTFSSLLLTLVLLPTLYAWLEQRRAGGAAALREAPTSLVQLEEAVGTSSAGPSQSSSASITDSRTDQE